jgi:uncharacterized peroxidase-related enzyme
MSRFEAVNHPGDPEVQQLFKEIIATGWGNPETGVPNNWFTNQVERPDILKAGWAFIKGVLMEGQLPFTVKEMLAMAIAKQNNCRYCTVGHTRALEAMGVPTAVIESCASDPELSELPPPQRAIVKFGIKAAKDAASITAEDVQSLRDHGLSDGEIMEISMVAAVAVFLDIWAEVSAIEVEG